MFSTCPQATIVSVRLTLTTCLLTYTLTNKPVYAANFATAEEGKENLLRQMQDLLGAMSSEDQDAFMAELNVSAQAMLEHHADDATAAVDLTQPKRPTQTTTTTEGLFAAAYKDLPLLW